MSEEPWRPTPDGIVVACRLTPRGGRDAVDGVASLSDGTRVLLARVRSAPEDGRANDALCALLASVLDTSASRIRVAAGARGRVKQIAVIGDSAALMARLRAL
jgi:uncharacterized protein